MSDLVVIMFSTGVDIFVAALEDILMISVCNVKSDFLFK